MEDFGGEGAGRRAGATAAAAVHIAQGSIIPARLRRRKKKEAIWKGPVLGVVVTR